MGNQRNPQTAGLVSYKTNSDFPELKAPRGATGPQVDSRWLKKLCVCACVCVNVRMCLCEYVCVHMHIVGRTP